MFLRCGTNNLAETILNMFKDAIEENHSQWPLRIERLWRDVYRCVCHFFGYVFYAIEQSGILLWMNLPQCLTITDCPQNMAGLQISYG